MINKLKWLKVSGKGNNTVKQCKINLIKIQGSFLAYLFYILHSDLSNSRATHFKLFHTDF